LFYPFLISVFFPPSSQIYFRLCYFNVFSAHNKSRPISKGCLLAAALIKCNLFISRYCWNLMSHNACNIVEHASVISVYSLRKSLVLCYWPWPVKCIVFIRICIFNLRSACALAYMCCIMTKLSCCYPGYQTDSCRLHRIVHCKCVHLPTQALRVTFELQLWTVNCNVKF
jgi:hypothetical protein